MRYPSCGLSENLECRSETCCTRLAANTGRKKVAKNRHLGTIAQLCRAISSQLRHVSTIENKIVKQQYLSPTCIYNMVNFGPLTAEIGSGVWGTPTNFTGFCVLAALLHSTGRQPNFAALNRGCHLCSAGRPSGWALAHISSSFFFSSPNLSRRRLGVCHTSTHGVALVRI